MVEPNEHEKTPLQSKKFIAFIVAEVTWKVAMLVLLVLGMSNAKIDIFVGSIAMGIVVVVGAIEALYLGGQAGLDKYIRIAQIATKAGHGFSMGKVTVKPVPKAGPPEEPSAKTPPKDG